MQCIDIISIYDIFSLVIPQICSLSIVLINYLNQSVTPLKNTTIGKSYSLLWWKLKLVYR